MENGREVLVEVNHLNVTYGSGKKHMKLCRMPTLKFIRARPSVL